MGAGVLGVIPLTGVVTPFLSYGGSAMTANFAALGILAAMSGDRRPRASLDPFRVGTRYLATAIGAGALALVAAIVNVQIVHGDEYVVRPHLSLQGDGVRRYQYNPRVLDIVRRIPRGTVYDRQGLPLATDDRAVLLRSRQAYRALGVPLDQACPNPVQRCYPLGGLAFHLLGDSRTRLNWAATNTSYVERDAEDRLRGFEHHHELVPLLRHRYEPNHPDVKAVMARSRDLRLTVDARFQSRVASALAERARGRKAAAVVLDPNTGEVLAMASYPWPVGITSLEATTHRSQADSDALLDRARYGLYPPGSTFKLVTAAAALRRDIRLSRTTFTCQRLSDGRVGTRIAGWGRPIRDDVLVTRPHGSMDMHEGIVHSCNAYFAQLAARLGPKELVDAAAPFGILLTPSNSLRRVRDTLPQAGYGQGDVVTTPLRMARVAAALAADGTVRETRWEAAPPGRPGGKSLLPPDAAHLLASYLRDAVVSGTGRRLSAHPWRIAGKTGTAEVAGSPSHAWFVGFAPYGAATRRIAFAVIIENAGYGSATASPVAGEIVTAAASAGLIH
jgi:cell division protein FtsI/penicillin-binding protein 2